MKTNAVRHCRILSALRRAVLLLAAFAFATAARAGTFSTAAWTDDASTGIATGRTLWAYHFGATTTATFNGVTTPGFAGPNASNSHFDLTGMTSFFNADTNNVTGTGGAVMAHDFVYGGTPAIIVKNLTVGRNYVVSFFSVGWQADSGVDFRNVTFSSGADSQLVKQDQFGSDNGIRVDYAFTATAATRAITIAVANGNGATFHLYGLALQRPPPVTNTNDGGAGSLRQALLDAASYAGADTVMFDAGLNGSTITLLSEIVSNDASGAVSIDASTLPAGLTIDGGPNANRILSVSAGRNVSLTGVTLTGGNGGGAAQGGNGGAIVNFGTLALTRCTLSGDTSGSGGAILNDGGTLTLTQCTLSANSATRGGAIFQTTGTLTLTQCTLSANQANGISGGAIYNQTGALTLTQCTFSGNQASGSGGAIHHQTGALTLTQCTVSGNQGDFGGAIYNGGQVTLTNSIVTGNTPIFAGPDIYGNTVTPTGVNFIGDTTGSGLSAGPTILTTAANGPIKLAPLGNYGGPRQTMALMPGSPAIDAVTAGNEIPGLTTDQRGFPRNVDGDGTGGAAPDLGAVELSRVVVTTGADQLDVPAGAQTSLREAIRDGADLVAFDAALSGQTATLTSALGGEIVVGKNVTIDASGLPGGLTIDGGAGTNRIFSVGSGKSLALLGLTLTGGNGSGLAQNGNGGAIVNFGTLALTRCTLAGNVGDNAGAILNDGGALTLTQCTLSGNQTSGVGGAIFQTTGMATLTQCTLFGNQTSRFGGAIDKQNGALTLAHCTVSGNQGVSGGAIYNSGPITLINSIVAGNTASASPPDITTSFFLDITPTGVNFIGDPAGSGLTANSTILTTAANGPINLTPLGSNGGPTKTVVPRPGSPAIDGASFIAAVTTDQRGFPRPVENGPSGELPDIGAVEVQTAVVTTAADELNTPASGGAGISLREALRDGADRIVFTGTFSGEILLGSPLEVAKYVTIDASAFAAGITVNGGDAVRGFHIAPGVSASFIRLTITNCVAASSGFPAGYGGGIYVEGALTLTECILQGCGAYVGAGAYVANNGAASLTLHRSTVWGNGADFGGGIQNEGTLIAHGSTFAGNSATPEGGAISAPFGKPVTLKHCTVSRNTAGTGGGVAGSNLTLENSILSGNTATTGPNATTAPTLIGTNIVGPDPVLAPPSDYGGPTQTMALRPGSPARDAATGSTIITDQRGFPLVGTPDIGAYEAGTLANYNAYIWESLPTAGNGLFHDPLHAATFDFDGDGVTNGHEYLALTDAADPTSYLRITQLVRAGNDLQFTFPSVLGRNYTFEHSPDLAAWTPIGAVFPGPGGPFTLTYTNFFTGKQKLFLRARVGP